MLDAWERDHHSIPSGSTQNALSVSTGPRLSITTKTEPRPDFDDDEIHFIKDDSAELHETPSPGAGQMTQDDRGNYRWIGSSNTLSLLDSLAHRGSPQVPTPPIIEQGTSSGGNHYFGHVAGSGVVNALPGINEVVFPSIDAGMRMIDAFFRDTYPVLPVVIEEDFRKEYDAVMRRRARGEPEKPGGVSREFPHLTQLR